MRRAIAIRHTAFEDLGSFEQGLKEQGFKVEYLDAGVDDLGVVGTLEPDLLIVLGGPIGANDDSDFPFLTDELRMLEHRLGGAAPTIGICLGAQLLARAADARVYAASEKEIGFMPITLTEAGRSSCLAPFEGDGVTLHWHGDQCDLPNQAMRLASTELCQNQAFSLGPNVIAFQFHPEIAFPGFERWLIGNALELSLEGRSVARLRAEALKHDRILRDKAQRLLLAWLGQVQW